MFIKAGGLNMLFDIGKDAIYKVNVINRYTIKDLNYDLDDRDKKTKVFKSGIKRNKAILDNILGVYMFKHKTDGVIYVGSCGGDSLIKTKTVRGVHKLGWSLYNRIPQHRLGTLATNYFSKTGKPFGPYLSDCKVLVLSICDHKLYNTDKLFYRQVIRSLENYLNYRYEIKANKKGVNFYSIK